MIRALARASVGNPVAVNLATAAVAAIGLMAFIGMPREVFPEFSLGTVTVSTLWGGATPEDVERLITLPIEQRVEGVEGLDDMTSRSQEGISILTLRAREGADMDRFLNDVRSAVQSGGLGLPDDAQEPVIREIRSEFPAIAVFIYGSASEEELAEIGTRHRRELEQIDGVSRVTVKGKREPRIWVEVDPVALERYSLTLAEVGAVVRARTIELPLGSLTTVSGDYLLRVDSSVERAEDLRDLPVRSDASGVAVRLRDVARVVDSFQRPIARARFNGQPCIHMQVNKSSEGDAIQISRDVFAYIEREQARMPPGTALGANSDLSVYIRNRLAVMRDSATLGGLLVLVSLVLFLNLRIAFMTALGIPLAFLGGLAVAAALGTSMNMITMFALIVVLGMIVDDAIVVGENAYRLMEEGMSPVEAAIQGTAEVGKPVLATILTTVAAFLPILMIGGMTGFFLRPLPLVVSLCLGASLLEALIVLPSHLAHWSGQSVQRDSAEGSRWYEPMRERYVRVLESCIRWRYVTISGIGAVAVLLVGFAYLQIPFVMFDDFESKVFSINIRTRTGTSMQETERLAGVLEDVVLALPESEVESVNTLAGVSYLDASRFTVGQNLGQIWVELREDVGGRRPTSVIIEDLRQKFLDAPNGIESIDVTQPQAGPTGRAIDVAIRGPDLAILGELAEEMSGYIAGKRGVRDVHDDLEGGKREVHLALKEEGRQLGFDEASLGRELRAAFEGTTYGRVRRGSNDVEVVVKYPEAMRMERGVLEKLRVAVPARPGMMAAGSRVPLNSVAEIIEVAGASVITRENGERSVRVIADVNKQEGNSAEITAQIEREYADLGDRLPGYSITMKGEAKDMEEAMAGLESSLLIALLVIYVILGTLFRSLSQPFVIMFAIPFGAIGAVIGHMLMDRPISFMSLIGFLALTGIVVNDSLILVDFVNARRRAGESLQRALSSAGRLRFRPILLTSITTMLGLLPLTFFASGQARFLQPMAITVFFGLTFSTVLILIVVPCAFGVLEDVRAWVSHPRRTLGRMRARTPLHPSGEEGVAVLESRP